MKNSTLKSWRTTFFGTVAGIAGTVAAASPDPKTRSIAAIVAAVATGLLGVSARDHKSNPEQPASAAKTDARPSGALESLILGASLAGAVTLTSCTTTSTPAEKVQTIASVLKIAAYDGTTIALIEHPEWMPAFQDAALTLASLEEGTNKVDIAEIVILIQRLPVKELKSDEARLVIVNATLLLEEFGKGTTIDLSQYDLKPLAAAMRRGIELGLSRSMVPPPIPAP